MKKLITPSDLRSEEHERQIARFLKEDYVPGKRLARLAWARWKTNNRKAMEEAAALVEKQRRSQRRRPPGCQEP